MGKLVYIKTGQAVTGGQSAPTSGRGLMHLDGTPVERKSGTQSVKAKETKAVTPSVSPRPMENASTANNRPNSRLLADVQTGGTTPPSLDNGRVGKVLSGAAKSAGAGYVNTAGVAAEGAGKLNTKIYNANNADSIKSDQEAVARYEKMLRDVKWANGKAMSAKDVKTVQGYLDAAKRRLAASRDYTEAVEQSDKAVADKAYQKADRLSQSSAADVAQAKEGLGPVGQFAVDLGVQGVQMAGDVAASAVIPGAGLALMTARSAGSSAQRARQTGATYGQQLAYGLGSGALSLATEKISNVADPFKKAFGGGVLDKAISGALAKMNNSAAGRVALSMISEGGEEFIEDIFQPVLQRATYDPSARFDLSEALYDAAVGAAMGGIGAGVDVIRQRGSSQADAQPTQEARPEVREGIDTPTFANAAEGVQNAVPGVETAPKYDPIQAAAIRHEGKTFRNLVAGFDTTVTDFFQRWKNGRSNTSTEKLEKLYLGKISETARQQASNILGYDLSSRDMIVTNDDVKHIVSSHGKANAEVQRGNLPLAQWAIEAIPDVVTNPDTVSPGDIQAGGKHPGKRGLLFSKSLPNGTVVTVQFDNKGRNTMELTTMYVKKAAPTTQAFNVENTSPQLTAKPVPESVSSASSEVAPVTSADVGPAPTASVVETTPVEGTRPLNANDSIAQGAENVKNRGSRDILSEVLFGKKRADMDAMTPEQQNAIYQANEAGTVGMDATGKVFQIDPEQHIDRRRMETVGGRDVNAFQFDHPELHRYYQEAANALIADADLSLQQPMSRRYERTMEGNAVQQAAQTSPHLRQAMDETGLSRDAIIDAAQRIITDQGQENVAAAKRVELILDDMLSNGYTTMTGEQVGPNNGYLTAKQSILGAGETQARGHGLDGVDGYDNLGSARKGFTTPGMEGTEQTSRLADTLPYNQYQESATGLNREDYAKIFRYESQTEGKSLHLAEELVYVKKDGQKTFLRDVDEGAFHELVQSLDDATAWNGPQMDAARMIQSELQGKSSEMEIPETEYIDFLKIMREHETATGQGVQANAKWSRKDNNGGQASELDAWDNLERSNLSDAEKTETFRQIVKWDTDIEAVKSGDTAAMKNIILDVAEARGVLNGVTGKESKALRSIAESSLNALTFDQLKQFAYASTSAMSTDATSANLGRKIKTIQILNMLSNPKTASKNVTGNTSFYALDALSMKGAALLDMAVSKMTGTRSMAADKISRSTMGAAVKAMKMSIAEITMDVDMDGASSRYGTGSQRTFKANGNFAERVLSSLERNQAYLLNATDEFYKGAAKASEANTQRLIDEGKIKTSDKDYAKKQADQLAKYRTFQDNSKMSVAIQTVHDVFNMLGIGDSGKTIGGQTVHSFGVGDIVAPFTRVAGNLVSRGIEYSPINAMKGTVEIAEAVAKAANNGSADLQLQSKGVSDLARGMTGTAIAYGFMQLVKLGLMRKADDEDDEKVAALNRAEGMTGTQLNLSAAKRWLSGGGTEWQYGDTLIDLSSVEPLNLLMDLGAELAKSEGNPVVSTFKATGKSFMSASADLPVAQFIGNVGTDVLKYNKDPMESIIKEGASTVASSLTPNVLRAAAQGLDDRPRSTGYADTFAERLALEAKSRIPGLRETLPGSVDALGNERMYQGTTPERLFNSMLNPVGVNHYQQGELSKDLESLRERSGGNTSFYPTNRIPKEISFTDKSGKTHTAQMDYEQRQDFQRTRGTVTNGTMMAMTGTRAYKKASAERQVELMAKCQSYGYEVAKGGVLGKAAMESWAVNAQTSKKDVGLSTVEFLALYTDDRYKSYLSGKAYEKTKEAYRAGVSVEEYVGLKESADTNGNGTISKAEASVALAGQENRADLWDIICTTNAKNPYK